MRRDLSRLGHPPARRPPGQVVVDLAVSVPKVALAIGAGHGGDHGSHGASPHVQRGNRDCHGQRPLARTRPRLKRVQGEAGSHQGHGQRHRHVPEPEPVEPQQGRRQRPAHVLQQADRQAGAGDHHRTEDERP